ncbi:hypothetical protein [Pontibacter ramchanderi]|uniref:HTH cro/C1-type domain-containing protein n=1 Tax=Pontibacter ramchanderi TaxID=1179743 RepID=A0A2N3U8A5_9BACT|nr:hypothetical protein [Pontibacter ramchanderi]PKV62989.1 hypothetical protein BD749_2822 [Pontibacter ramchanderi]
MKINILWINALLLIIIFSSCRNDNVSPIRNVRFDPGLLNPLQAADGAPCISHSYYYNDAEKSLGTVYGGMVLLSFSQELTYEEVTAAVGRYGYIEALGQPVQSNSARLYPARLAAGLSCRQVQTLLADIAKDPAVRYAAPYFESAGGELLGISNEFIVRVETGRMPAAQVLQRLANATRTEVVSSLSEDTFVLRADKNSRGNALEMANFFQKQPHIKHAEPDFVVSLAM